MKLLTSIFALMAFFVFVAFSSTTIGVHALPSSTPTAGIQLIQDYIRSLNIPPQPLGSHREASISSSTAGVCPFNMSNDLSFLAFYGTVLEPLMSQSNWTARCNIWPSAQPCIAPFLARLNSNSSGIHKMEATFGVYEQFCQKMGNDYCYVSADILVARHSCYYQTPQKGAGCDKDACYVSTSGDSCVPRASPDYFAVYCGECFPKIRSVLVAYYQLVSANVTSGSSSSTSGSNSGKTTTQGTDYGIILTDAGFAAVDARVAYLCTPGCSSTTNPFTSQAAYSETLSRILFDFSAGAPSYITGSDVAGINALSTAVCPSESSDPTGSALLCFRRFVSTWLTSNRVLAPFLQQTCLDGRNASEATCTLEDRSLDARAAWWRGDLAATRSSLCGQKGHSGAAVGAPNCLAVPAATFAVATSNACFKQAFDSVTITAACMTNVTSTLTSWGCCVQTLVNPADPQLNPAVQTFVINFIDTEIKGSNPLKCVGNSNSTYNFDREIGLRLTTLPYFIVSTNATIAGLLRTAIVADISAAIGATELNLGYGSIQFVQAASGVSNTKQSAELDSDAYFSSSSSSSTKVETVAPTEQTAVIVGLSATSNSELTFLASSYESWLNSSVPSSPEINTVLNTEGYGSSVGSSSVAAYSVPSTPVPGTPGTTTPITTTPGTTTPGTTGTPTPGAGNGDSGSKDGMIAGAAIAGVLGIGVVIFIAYRVHRKKGTGVAASERGSEIGDYAEVQ